MLHQTTAIAGLVGSRICHDLISPIGAIGNGVELLEMSGSAGEVELELVSQSANSANLRIRFFRIAYGTAQTNQMVRRSEIEELLTGMKDFGRTEYIWRNAEDTSRPEVKLAFLLVQCLETCLPRGGTIEVLRSDSGLTLVGHGQQVSSASDLWNVALGKSGYDDLKPATVQFALTHIELQSQNRNLDIQSDNSRIVVTV